MGVTVGANYQSVVHKGADAGLTVVFPDVCKTPSPIAPVPLPYPNVARTAQAVQAKRKSAVSGSVSVKQVSSTLASSAALLPTTARAGIAIQGEIQQLKVLLNQLNAKLLAMDSIDPNQWQLVLQDYAVAASALYLTIHNK